MQTVHPLLGKLSCLTIQEALWASHSQTIRQESFLNTLVLASLLKHVQLLPRCTRE